MMILFFYVILFIFNSNEDSGANFWVPFKMDPKFQDFEKLILIVLNTCGPIRMKQHMENFGIASLPR